MKCAMCENEFEEKELFFHGKVLYGKICNKCFLDVEKVCVSSIKRMGIKEFREMGLLAEVNRVFFHPLGLALEVIVDDNGTEKLGSIWDYRDNPEGVLYSKGHFPAEKIKKAHEFIKQKHEQRMKTLGFIYQDPDNPQ